jgi:ABC-type phosphate transport system permease subunit
MVLIIIVLILNLLANFIRKRSAKRSKMN